MIATKLDVRLHRDQGGYYLYLPAGRDRDGQPLIYAILLTPLEAQLWQCGKMEELTLHLASRGVPLTQEQPRAKDGAGLCGWVRRLMRKWFGSGGTN
jgi:hypothetical protein